MENIKYKIPMPETSEAVQHLAKEEIEDLDKYYTREEVNQICAWMLYLSTQA